MKTFLLSLVLGFSLFGAACSGDVVGHDSQGRRIYDDRDHNDDVQEIRQALWCDGLNFDGSCYHWAPSAPTQMLRDNSVLISWFNCNGDNNAYFGENVITTGANKTGYCYYIWVADTSFAWVGSFGDFDRTNPTYFARSIQIQSRNSDYCDAPGQNGCNLGGSQGGRNTYWSDFHTTMGWDPSSMRINFHNP